MTQTYEALRDQLKSKLIAYLKTDNLPYYPPSLTVCPSCGEQAGIIGDTLWSCPACKKHGDLVDYWQGTATQLVEELQQLDPGIEILPNRLARVLNACRKLMEHELFISYTMKKENNNKTITLDLLPEEDPHAGEEDIDRTILLNRHLKGKMFNAAEKRLAEEEAAEEEAAEE